MLRPGVNVSKSPPAGLVVAKYGEFEPFTTRGVAAFAGVTPMVFSLLSRLLKLNPNFV